MKRTPFTPTNKQAKARKDNKFKTPLRATQIHTGDYYKAYRKKGIASNVLNAFGKTASVSSFIDKKVFIEKAEE